MLLYDVAQALQEAGVPFAVAGGYAVALHGAVRGTMDVDIVIRRKKADFIAAEKALAGIGLSPLLPVSAADVFDFREEYIRNRNLLAWSFRDAKDPSRLVDILLLHDLSGLKVARIRAGRRMVPVLARAELIAMKRASGRPQDIEDARALEGLP